VLEVFYHHAKFGGTWISPATRAANNVEFLPAAARSAKRRYLSYSQGDFEIFCPASATHCTDGVKFAKFHPYWCNDKGIGRTPKTKNFTEILQNFRI